MIAEPKTQEFQKIRDDIYPLSEQLQQAINSGLKWEYASNYTELPVLLLQKYAEGKPVGHDVVYKVTNAVRHLLRYWESISNPSEDIDIVETGIYHKIQRLCDFARNDRSIAIIDGPAGSGKSLAVRGLKRQYPVDILVVADVLTKSPTAILPFIARQVPLTVNTGSNSQFLHRIIDALKNTDRLLIIDEAHFLTWETLEALRRLNDAAQIGIVLCGQERLYQEMKRQKGPYLWDQISSRLGMRYTVPIPSHNDTDILSRHLCPGLDDKSLDYLHQIAQTSGRFRAMVRVLEQAQKISEIDDIPLSAPLLHEISKQHLL